MSVCNNSDNNVPIKHEKHARIKRKVSQITEEGTNSAVIINERNELMNDNNNVIDSNTKVNNSVDSPLSSSSFEFSQVHKKQKLNDKPIVWDICCGLGSFSHAANVLNASVGFACDMNPKVRKVYSLLYPDHVVGCAIDSLTTEDWLALPKPDVLCAGFPCQPFSLVGKKTGAQHKFGLVWCEIIDVVRIVEPKCVVLENVKGLTAPKQAETLNAITLALQQLGYCVTTKLLSANHFNCPQTRTRLFIIANKTHPVHLNIPQIPLTQTLSVLTGQNLVRDVSHTLRIGGRSSKPGNHWNWTDYQIVGSEPPAYYHLSIEDMLRLQGFEPEVVLPALTQVGVTCQYAMIGNSIPTCLSIVVLRTVLNNLLPNV